MCTQANRLDSTSPLFFVSQMAVNVQRRHRGHSLFFTPLSEATEPSISNTRPAARRQTRTNDPNNDNFGSNPPSGRIPRSSSSPLLYQVPAHSSGSLRGYPTHEQQTTKHPPLTNSRSHSNLPRVRSGSQPLHPFYSQPPPSPQSLIQPKFGNSSQYSGSDAEDDEDNTEGELLSLRNRRGKASTRKTSSPLVSSTSVHTSGMVRRRTVAEPQEEEPHEMHMDKQSFSIGFSGNTIHWSINIARIMPILFQCLRVLAVIPASVETLGLLARVYNPIRAYGNENTRLDYVAAAAWVSMPSSLVAAALLISPIPEHPNCFSMPVLYHRTLE
ncbi:4693_t:CDS:2 [Acaulospora colombiana]|uniref:4693_t:CDS:1 n=1 Tax=Acaulospora colombiana TaxID=27376 RepID=A0ACA9M4D8_9GLOM|nr:4693_t:CDS:2 [Acaulospora colombiana]